MGLECGWRHAQKRWSWEFEDFENTAVEIRPLKIQLSFLPLRHAVDFFRSRPAEMNWDLKHHKMRRALGLGQHRMVSIGFQELSLCSCRHGPKPEINKPVLIRNERVHLYLYMYLYYCCDWYHYGYATLLQCLRLIYMYKFL